MNTKDLFVLVADKNMRFAFEAGLGRPQALGTGPFTFEIKNQPGFDGAMRTAGARTLSLLANQYTHALMVLDFEGSGADRPAVELEELLDQDLSYHWQSRAKSIVIEPELDCWVWGSDRKLQEILKWEGTVSIRDWLDAHGFRIKPDGKPARPKEAIEAVMEFLERPRSSALYREIAESISLQRCADPAFRRLVQVLRNWFPPA